MATLSIKLNYIFFLSIDMETFLNREMSLRQRRVPSEIGRIKLTLKFEQVFLKFPSLNLRIDKFFLLKIRDLD